MSRTVIRQGPAREALAAEVKEAYAGGMTIRQVAEDFGWSYGRVHRILVESGTAFRPRGGAPRTQQDQQDQQSPTDENDH